jgi:hypothetical protein
MAKKKLKKKVAIKKSYYKKKLKKGVWYVANSLVKYQPKKYTSVKGALKDAKAILAKLKKGKKKVILYNILGNKTTEKKSKKTPPKKSHAPVLTSTMAEAQFYFNVLKYGEDIENQDKRIKFISPQLFPKGYSIQGGQKFDEDYFIKFIRFCNKQVADYKADNDGDDDDDRYSLDWLVVCTEPKENKKVKGEWVSTIITTSAYSITDASERGVEPSKVNYGYNPNEEEQDIPALKPSPKVKSEEVEKPSSSKDKKSEKEIELEILKEKRLSKEAEAKKAEAEAKKTEANKEARERLDKMFMANLISKLEWKEEIDKLR